MAGEWFVLAGTALPAMLEFLPRVLYDTYRMVIKREGWEFGLTMLWPPAADSPHTWPVPMPSAM